MNRAERRKQAKKQNGPALHAIPKEIQGPLGQALSHFQAGRLPQSEAACRHILQIDPDQANALNLLGMIAQRSGKDDIAMQLISKSVASNPNFADAHSNLGNLKMSMGQLDDAVASYRTAISINPNFPDAYSNLGLVYARMGEHELALKNCRKAISLKADYAEPYNCLGIIHGEMGFEGRAIDCYRKAISINRNFADAYTNLAVLLTRMGELDKALDSAQKAVSLNPKSPKTHNNLGIIYNRIGRYDDAVASFRTAIRIDPNNAESYNNMGNVYSNMGDLEQALLCHEEAISINPYNPGARNNISLIQLLKGNFSDGWKNFEGRFVSAENLLLKKFPGFSAPQWNGEDLANKRILIWGEQGVGDEVLFTSMVPDQIRAGADIVLQSDKRLKPLLARSFPSVTCITTEEFGYDENNVLKYDYHSPLGHMGNWLRPDQNSFPDRASYLVADSDHRNQCRDRYLDFGNDTIVGISWSSKGPDYGEGKSMSLPDLRPVLEIPGVTFVDLQYGDTGDERAAFQKETGIEIVHDDCVDQLANLDDFASQVAAMDYVVTISNTTAHFAGALGIPSMVMLGYAPLWYWQLERDDCLWYPMSRLFRQAEMGDWSGVVSQTAEALAQNLLKAKS